TGRFEGRLGRVGEAVVLDVSPAPQKGEPPNPALGLMVDGHLFLVLDIGTDEVAMTALDPDSLLASLRSGVLRLPYHESKEEFILHGTTAGLREALGPHLKHPGALPERGKWSRARRTTAKAIGPVDPPCFEASAWREADSLFRGDPHWLGSDCASTVDIGGGRVLWLFGDTWIDPSGRGTRRGARMVSNSVAIQTGTDPSRATMKFYWGRTRDGAPAAIIPDEGGVRHWFGNGVRVDDRLVLFLGAVVNTNSGLGFESAGWAAWMVENPDAEPPEWRMHRLETPTNVLGVSPGFTAVRRAGEYVYAFGSEDPVKSHPLYAVRWQAEDLRAGRLMAPEWWAGERLGWIPESSTSARFPLFENGAPEMSIHFDEASGRFIAVQGSGFGAADVMLRAAPSLTGPWSRARMVYRPMEYYKPDVMIYAAKAHPELTGADLVLTYATNGTDIGIVANDSQLYYPRFVRLTRCR
ncbi:MAG TPA: DUF4185 domain-containing protein, partial [Bacteroidota bacterium]|nr:DUF4185 domain-containing protein [Bacteroidota bacterium]